MAHIKLLEVGCMQGKILHCRDALETYQSVKMLIYRDYIEPLLRIHNMYTTQNIFYILSHNFLYKLPNLSVFYIIK
jgi:hypothetical protein